jgi:O-antigen ligase
MQYPHKNSCQNSAFRIKDYPIFFWSLGYIWIEIINPLIAIQLQIVPKIPNGAFVLFIALLYIPNYLKQQIVPFNHLKWTLPFLLLATLNILFIDYARVRSIFELLSTWFYVIFFIPLIIKVLSTSSGRFHFFIFSFVSVGILSLQYMGVLTFRLASAGIIVTRHHLVPGVIFIMPLAYGYLFLTRGKMKYLISFMLLFIIFVTISSGSRSAWVILAIELILLFFIIPKRRILGTSIIIASIIAIFFSYWNLGDIYNDVTYKFLKKRWRKTVEFKDDHTIIRRAAMLKKTEMILSERPLLGIGYSNRSFSSFDGGKVEIFGQVAAVKQYDAHNTFFNLLGGTGILGFLTFLYYIKKVFWVMCKIPRKMIRELECKIFIIAILGNSLWFLFATVGFFIIAMNMSILLALFVFYYNK